MYDPPNKEDDMGGTFFTNGRDEECVQYFGREN